MDSRPILFLCGIVLSSLAILMLIPMGVDYFDQSTDWQGFLITIFITLALGMSLVFANHMPQFNINVREAFVMTTATWVCAAIAAALPFMLTSISLSPTDAFFEATSGITTTGSTIINNLDTAHRGILLWRALLQWVGGIGFIVVAIAILPFLRVGGMQLFSLESSEKSDKFLPRAGKISKELAILYFVLTLLCCLALMAAGLSSFDAITHAMTTMASGGFSTHDDSIAFFQNPHAEFIIMIFMLLSALPFFVYLRCLRQGMTPFLRDGQTLAFLMLALGAICIVGILHHATSGDQWRMVAFNTISFLTGTGFSTADTSTWGSPIIIMLFITMLIGGCAGSTTCGIKIFRLQIIRHNTHSLLNRLIHPHGVFIPRYQGRPVPDDITQSVLGFVFLFFTSLAMLAFALGITGLDFQSSLTAAATAIANVGPALGESLGPSDTFAQLPQSAKWLMTLGMLIGRLELYTVLILFVPRFWKR